MFIIHGRRDEIVPFYHAEELFKASKNKYPPYYVEGAGHNNVEKFASDYLVRIRQFIQHVDEWVNLRLKEESNLLLDGNGTNGELNDEAYDD